MACHEQLLLCRLLHVVFWLSGTRGFSYLPFHRCNNVALYINKAADMNMVHSSNRLHHNDLDL